jgi:metal-responsive CopG/Arc/MetJ family transcriptional regulator
MTAKRVLISLDERLLARIDQAVERRGLTRSGYLAQLASADLEGQRGPAGDPVVGANLQRVSDLFDESR